MKDVNFLLKLLNGMQGQLQTLKNAGTQLTNIASDEAGDFTGKEKTNYQHQADLEKIINQLYNHVEVHQRELSNIEGKINNYYKRKSNASPLKSSKKSKMSPPKQKTRTPLKPSKQKTPKQETPISRPKQKTPVFKNPNKSNPQNYRQYVRPSRRLSGIQPPKIIDVETPHKPTRKQTPHKSSPRKSSPHKRKSSPHKSTHKQTPRKSSPHKRKSSPHKQTPRKSSPHKQTPHKSRKQEKTPPKSKKYKEFKQKGDLCTDCLSYLERFAKEHLDKKWVDESRALSKRERIRFLYKLAQKQLHPDKGGDVEIFKSLTVCNDNASSNCF